MSTSTQIIDSQSAHTHIQAMLQQIAMVVKGKTEQLELVLTCLIAGGHVLIEDNPGSGKTVMARSVAQTIHTDHNQSFKRIQFTPDLLPMDLLGSHIYDSDQKDFIFKKGPLFCNILLADEINRASPKVQSALLECMAEGQITMGDKTYKLEDVFFTIATQNPIEMEGTYPLPAAQLDRFYMKINFGYVDAPTEIEILSNYHTIHNNLQTLQPVISIEQIAAIQQLANEVSVHPAIIQSIADILTASRNDNDLHLGASTRAGITVMKCLRAYALLNGRTFVTEQDLLTIVPAVLQHRLIFTNTSVAHVWIEQQLNAALERLRKINI